MQELPDELPAVGIPGAEQAFCRNCCHRGRSRLEVGKTPDSGCMRVGMES